MSRVRGSTVVAIAPPTATDAVTAVRMRRVRRQHTAPELALRRELFGRGVRYGLHAHVVPGHPRRAVDIAVRRARVAVFVDGCFWHGCMAHRSVPKSNNAWWRQKFDRVRQRDVETTVALEEAGWRVVRVWEHEGVSSAADRVEAAIQAGRR